MLGKKQVTKNEAWITAIKDIELTVPYNELQDLVDKTVQEISQTINGYRSTLGRSCRPAFCWSGGKDSIVLERLCDMAGIKNSVLVVCNLEYPAFMKWLIENAPPNLEIVNTGQDLAWLARHENLIFPQNSRDSGRWFRIVQHAGQTSYFKKHYLDMLILGRRRADGNYIGKKDNIYTNSAGVTRYSPIAYWRHEHILAFIHYYNIPLPPIYSWPNGYLCGTHPWPARQWTGSVENGWAEVYDIDPSIVADAAAYIKSAEEFFIRLAKGGKDERYSSKA